MATEILVVGLSHHTAPVDVRERLSVATESMGAELRTLLDGQAISEGVLLSTCNRVELYAAAPDAVSAAAVARAHLLSKAGADPIDEFLYERWGGEAVEHAFRVASSLDSMVVGEPQILGQVKTAYAAAEGAGGVGTLLGRCFHRAFAVAKRVRTETGIAAGAVSVSSIAIELASKIFDSLEGRRALLVGAGKMSEAAAKSLANHGARLYVVNRSPERAERLAKICGGTACGYEQLVPELVKADVAITSTASPRFVITRELMQDVLRARRGRPLFLIDIAVPRDVDPRVGEMRNVFLYDVDDLQKVAEENLAARKREADAAEQIVRGEAEIFEQWRRSLTLTPTIVALRQRFREVVKAELERTVSKMDGLGTKDRRKLDAMTEAMVNKLLHQPLTQLKANAEGHNAALLIDAARRLFQLEDAVVAPEKEGRKAPAAKRAPEQDAESPSEQDLGGLAAAGPGGEGT